MYGFGLIFFKYMPHPAEPSPASGSWVLRSHQDNTQPCSGPFCAGHPPLNSLPEPTWGWEALGCTERIQDPAPKPQPHCHQIQQLGQPRFKHGKLHTDVGSASCQQSSSLFSPCCSCFFPVCTYMPFQMGCSLPAKSPPPRF